MLDFVLVSQSPRRRQLLKDAGYVFESVSVDTPETLDATLSPAQNAMNIAKHKVLAYQTQEHTQTLLSADTIVVCGEDILGKPKDKEEATLFLKRLQNYTHEVITGVCVARPNQKPLTFYASTKVSLYPMLPTEIEFYLTQYHPFDKAGSYGAQDWIGLRYIKHLEGCFYNVMGFPVSLFREKFEQYAQ